MNIEKLEKLLRNNYKKETAYSLYKENEMMDRKVILKNENTKQRYNLLLKNIGKAKLEGNICVFDDSIVWGAWDKEKTG